MSTSVCLSVCLSFRENISGTRRAIFTDFFVHVACRRGLVLFQQGNEIPRGRGQFWGFSSPLTMHFNAFVANGIDREGVMGVHSADEV